MGFDASAFRTDPREPTPHVEALVHAITGRDRLTIVTGDAGTGKTTLCLTLAERFGPRNWGSLVLTPASAPASLLGTILIDLGGVAMGSDENYEGHLAALLDYLRHATGRATVIVDSAHDLPAETLAVLVRAAVDASRLDVALQVILVGLPALCETFSQPALHAAMQSVDARHEHLEPLAEADIKSFMERRWWRAAGGIGALAGASPTPYLGSAASRAAFRASLGNPRIVATIADRLREDNRVAKNRRVGAATVQHVVTDLGLPVTARPRWNPAWVAAGIAIVALGVAGIVVGAASRTNGPSSVVPRQVEAAPAPIVVANGHEADPPPAVIATPREQDFKSFRQSTLDAAARLSAAPDVRGMIRLEDAAKQWDAATNNATHAAVADLLTELDRLTDSARQRQLIADGRQIRESQSR